MVSPMSLTSFSTIHELFVMMTNQTTPMQALRGSLWEGFQYDYVFDWMTIHELIVLMTNQNTPNYASSSGISVWNKGSNMTTFSIGELYVSSSFWWQTSLLLPTQALCFTTNQITPTYAGSSRISVWEGFQYDYIFEWTTICELFILMTNQITPTYAGPSGISLWDKSSNRTMFSIGQLYMSSSLWQETRLLLPMQAL